MANIKIAQLTDKISLADTDLLIVESATQTMKMTVGKLKELLGIQGGGIEESGTGNGYSYTKYKDGTMTLLMNGTIALGTMTQLPSGIWWQNNAVTIDFPVQFSLAPYADLKLHFGEFISAGTRNITSLLYNANIFSTVDKTGQSINYRLLAVGRHR